MPESSKYPNPWHPDDPVKFSVVKRQWTLDFPWERVDEKTHSDLERGKLTMKCPYCGAINIAGPWCPKCTRMVTPENWINLSDKAGAKRKGRKSAEDIEEAFKSQR